MAPSGHICVVIDPDSALTVTGTKIKGGFLNERIVNYRESLLQVNNTLNYLYKWAPMSPKAD